MRGRLLAMAAAGAAAGAAALVRWRAKQIAAMPNRYSEEQLRREPPGTPRPVERPDGTRLRVLVAGEGPTVVLAHGMAMTAQSWNVVAEALVAKGFRVVCFDQRGHGQSTVGSEGLTMSAMAADCAAVLEQLDIRDAILVGHSMGGLLALHALVDHTSLRERVRGLVLASSLGGRVLDRAPQNRLHAAALRLGLVRPALASDTGRLLIGASLEGERPSPAEIRLTLELYQRMADRDVLALIDGMARTDLYGRLGELTVPTVVICGRLDRTTPTWHSAALAAGIPGARMEWLEGVGHMVNWEAPDAVIAAVASLAVQPAEDAAAAPAPAAVA